MIECLKQLKEKESAYKEAVDNANSFLHGDFRQSINRLIDSLVPSLTKAEKADLELDRSQSSNSVGNQK